MARKASTVTNSANSLVPIVALLILLRRSLYTDLQTLQKLYEDLILGVYEFEELKSTLLEELKDLQPSKKV